MRKFLLGVIMLFALSYTFAQVEGVWKMSAQAGALGVGPSLGDISWWSNNEADLATRACFFDDKFVFADDGTFSNVQDGETWIEPWQGMDPEGCGTPVSPHDGSNAATWTYDDEAGTITLDGIGAHLGLAKVYDGGELSNPADAPASITYPVEFNAGGDTMTINISIGSGYWRFILAMVPPVPVGTWRMSPQAAAMGVGPSLGDISWWSNSEADVITRACFFDDRFIFAADGTFSNEQDDESWIEPWQGMDPEGCGTPVSPHDGSNAATWTYDEEAGTLMLDGIGAHLGLAKVYDGGELSNPADAPASITYPVEFNEAGDTMTINISIGSGYWRFILTTSEAVSAPSIALPVTFDDDELDYGLTDFGGTTSSIVVDPSNSENNVVQTIKGDGAETWAGTTVAEPLGLNPAVPFEEGSTVMSVRVYSPEAGLPVLFKLEVWDNTSIAVETISYTTVANEWETIYFDFSNENPDTPPLDFANAYNKPVLFFNFGVDGGTAGELTFMWDDIEFGGSQVALPVTFDDNIVDYSLTDFGGNWSSIIADPSNPENNVVETMKDDGAQTWAGTTVGEPTGLVSAVPFEEGSTIMSIDVYSPEADLPILFKLEVWDNTSIAVETISYSTVANEWETIYFDFSNENPDTPPLDFANAYNKPVVFFNFGVDGATAGEMTFMWDNIEFGGPMGNLCVPEYTNGCAFGDGFTDFAIEQIENYGSGCEDLNGTGWSQYLELGPAILSAGQSHDLVVSSGYTGNFVSIWIDFNDDTFLTQDERVLENYWIELANQQYTVALEIPADATPGVHYMRARTNFANFCDDPCELYNYGEAEDYMVEIIEGTSDYCEDFDDLTAGGYVAGQLGSPWNTWGNDPGGADDAFVSDAYSNSPSNSFVVNDGAIDLIYEFGAEPIDAGTATYSHYMYVPTGFSGYFNVQSDPTPGIAWVIELYFDDGETGSFIVDGTTTEMTYTQDMWFMVTINFNLDTDMGEVWFDDALVHEFTTVNSIGGIDYYGSTSGGAPGAYFDDVCFMAEEPGNDLNPPLNLEADVNLYTVELTWDAPEGTGSDLTEIAYDDGTGEQSWWISGNPTSPDDMMALRLTMPEDGTLQEVAFFTRTGTTGPFNFADVWVCPDDGAGLPDLSNPYESFGEQVIENTVMEWLMFPLTTPLDMTSGEDFWIVANWVGGNTDGPFIGGDNTAPPAEDRNYWSNVPGVWNLFTTSNFMMRGYYSPAGKSYAGGGLNIITHMNDKDLVVPVSSLTNPVLSDGTQSWKAPTIITGAKELTGYNVYRDGAMIDNTSSESYDDMGLAPGTYEYYVTAVYDEGESDPSNTVSAEVIEIVSADCEDFDDLTVDGYVAEQLGGLWTTWTNNPGSDEDALVSDNYSSSPSNSAFVGGTTDLVHLFDTENITTGAYEYTLNVYVPSGFTGYFNLQKDIVPGTEWGFQVMMEEDGLMYIDGAAAAAVLHPFEYDTWINCVMMVDLDMDWMEFYVDGELVHEYQWSLGTFGDPGGSIALAGANYYANPGLTGTPPGAYFDDICFEDISADPCENFDDLTAGGYVAEQLGGLWNTWGNDPGGADDAMVSDAESYSPDNSFVVDNTGVDLVRALGNNPISSGAWLYEHFMYVPSGFSGYFNVQSEPTPGVAWVIELYFDDGGTGSFIVDGTTTEFEYTQDTWFWVGINFDLFKSLAEVWFDDDIVHAFATTTTIGGIDYWGSDSGGAPGAYFDDVCFGEGYLIDAVIDNVATAVQVFPNPASYDVNIESGTMIHNVIVYNFAGQLVANEQVNNTNYSVDVSNFEPGVYIFQIDTEEGRVTERIIVK